MARKLEKLDSGLHAASVALTRLAEWTDAAIKAEPERVDAFIRAYGYAAGQVVAGASPSLVHLYDEEGVVGD
jgi:hypothetical protein